MDKAGRFSNIKIMKIVETNSKQLIIKQRRRKAIIIGIVFVLISSVPMSLILAGKTDLSGSDIIIGLAITGTFFFIGLGVLLFSKKYRFVFNKPANRLTIESRSLLGAKKNDYEISLINSVYLSFSTSSGRTGRTRSIYRITAGLSGGNVLNIGAWIDNYAKAEHTARVIAEFLEVPFREEQ